jgi:RimJ/RimL family protein N-acetyltransferase
MVIVSLDEFAPADVQVMCQGDHDPELRRRFEFPTDFVPSIAHSERVLAAWTEENRVGPNHTFAVRSSGGELIGGCQVRPKSDGLAHVSYWTYPSHRGRGAACEALRLLVNEAFETLGLVRLEAHCDPDNTASRQVAMRAGFTEVETRDGRVVYVLAK